ncbi:MAG TPA: LuxR C-terminal-related transcriptional regulator [Dehalococcoidia bacterium]|nr:LuxR C-terminal-related transcriptional regulator [Dehalococcoidia bacterium]
MKDASLLAAREAFARHDWLAARDALLEARAAAALRGEDVYRLAECVWWLGEFRRALSLYEEAHQLFLQEGGFREAAMAALGIAAMSFMRGEEAYGSGWMGRALRLLEDQPPGPEHGYALFMEMSGNLQGGDYAAAFRQAQQLQEMGREFSDPNLMALGILTEGQALIKQGSFREGMRRLDEAMLAAVSDELAPEWAGNIYCQLMVTCHELGDLQRARQWTQATLRWCESLPAAGPFLGICRAHRAQLFQMQGAWEQAETEAARVCEELADFDLSTVAEAFYRLAELRRLRGDLAGAEDAFRRSHALGRDPQPGLALLRLSQGKVQEAFTSIRHALAAGPQAALHRAWLCIACVEISVAADRIDVARATAEELKGTAARFESSVLTAAAEQAEGTVLLSEGKPEEALGVLRSACLHWQQLNAPYESARVRVLLASCYEALMDSEAAVMELDAAAQVFRSLGAIRDLRAIDSRKTKPPEPSGLTRRELVILALLSEGHSNRNIAEMLTISEKTVARHLTNIYTKLGLSSRTEAVRFAFEHGLDSASAKNVVS